MIAGEVRFQDAGYGDELSGPLVRELQAEMVARYGTADVSPVAPSQFTAPHGAFVVARIGDAVVACGGLRRHDEVTVELKRMYVRPAHRRRGLASTLLVELENRSRAAGYTQIALETGLAQPEAMALYERHGYRQITGFGHYAGAELSRAYAKELRAGAADSRDTSASPSATPDR